MNCSYQINQRIKQCPACLLQLMDVEVRHVQYVCLKASNDGWRGCKNKSIALWHFPFVAAD